MPDAETPPRLPALAALGLLAAPYLLNDFANIYVHQPLAWLACDYGSRVFSLVCVAWLLRRRTIEWRDLQLQRGTWWRLMVGVFVATVAGVLLTAPTAREFFVVPVAWPAGFLPEIVPPWLHALDYWVGIAFVAVSEEVVFRGVIPRLLMMLGGSRLAALLWSSAVFGLAHWSFGSGSMVTTTLIGIVFGFAAQFSRSLWPVILAHYLTDLYALR